MPEIKCLKHYWKWSGDFLLFSFEDYVGLSYLHWVAKKYTCDPVLRARVLYLAYGAVFLDGGGI